MRKAFRAELLMGHKGLAIEVPFNPELEWNIASTPLWRGRRGQSVRGKLNGVPFVSFMVPRAGKFFVLIDEELQRDAGVAVGDLVDAALEPVATPRR